MKAISKLPHLDENYDLSDNSLGGRHSLLVITVVEK